MMYVSGFDRFAWAVASAGELMLIWTLFARCRAGSFPIFTTYIVQQIVATLVLYPICYHCPYRTYERWYWIFGILDELIQLLVIYELAVHVFRPTGTWARDVRKAFLILSCASTAAAFLLAWAAQPVAPRPIQTFMLRSDFFSSVLMSELFVGMVLLSSTAGLPWKTHAARIAQGLGAFSIICLPIGIIRSFVGLTHGRHINTQMGRIHVVVYVACEVYWIVMLWTDAPAPKELPETVRIQIYTLQRQVENDLIRIRSWRNN